MDVGRAQDVAIRWAGITFHLGGTSAQDSTPLLQGALRFPNDDAARGRQPGSGPRSGPVNRGGVGFLRTDSGATTASQVPTAAPLARPGGSHPRADRRGLRR
jgi:hypothetical protein